ncbi:MAG TPA: integrin alpha, partial [Gammaproteobacteria bacterium]|nr:integrin alpha [Gammaproteobacteria bacterium]
NIYKNVETNEGAALLFLGSGSGLGTEPAWIFESNQAGAQAGYALAGIGDINGDLLADVLISAPTYDFDGKTDTGMVWIFTGMDSPLGLSSIPYWSANGTQHNELFGSAVDGAGDVNGDGYLDLIVGARGYDEDLVDIGAAYLFTNSSSGMKSAADWKVSSDQTYSGFGISVAGLGDVNLDGFDDVAVGAHHYTDDQSLEGMVFAYRGSPIGLESTPKWTGGGNKADADFGFSIANAGDVDDDVNNDLLVGAPLYKRDERIVMGQASLFMGMKAGEVMIYNTFLPMLITGQ